MSFPFATLTPTMIGREKNFQALMREAQKQSAGLPVEIIGLFDMRTMSIGRKRNLLLAASSSEYVAFIDDDDRIEPCYYSEILSAIEANPGVDVIVFDVDVHGYARYGHEDKIARYDLAFPFDRNDGPFYQRMPNHLMVWRRALARCVAFPEKSHGEDADWAASMHKIAKTQARIDKVLYHYDFGPGSVSASSETDR